jgi:hypothetical protein
MRKLIALVCFTALVVAGVGTAGAAGLFTGKDVKNHSLTGKDIKRRSLPLSALNRSTQLLIKAHTVGGGTTPASQGEAGAAGPQGAAGTNGTNGASGSDAFSTAKWGVIGRNTLGSPVADFRAGPWEADGSAPPYGDGSLQLSVAGVPSGGTTEDAEKIDFGDQHDFNGDLFSSLTTLSYWVFADEDSLSGHDAPNMSIEVTGAPVGTTSGYTTLVRNPAVGTTGEWTEEDASGSDARWYSSRPFTGPHAGECTQGSTCSFATLQAAAGSASILSVGIGKGRDNSFTGAVDGVRVNDTVYDFEMGGVFPTAP